MFTDVDFGLIEVVKVGQLRFDDQRTVGHNAVYRKTWVAAEVL